MILEKILLLILIPIFEFVRKNVWVLVNLELDPFLDHIWVIKHIEMH